MCSTMPSSTSTQEIEARSTLSGRPVGRSSLILLGLRLLAR
jgi:hypothetical protein